MSFHLFEALGLVLGLIFGSFLNVCISRLPKHESIVKPRSRCPECSAPIRWYDNIPLLGWLLLRGRCRDCKQSISWRYPVVELATGLWFLYCANLVWDVTHLDPTIWATGITFPSASQIAIYMLTVLGIAILGFLLMGLVVMDWQAHLLPDAFTLTGIAIALFLVCTQAIFLGPNEGQILLAKHHIHLTSPGATVEHGNIFLTGTEALIFGRLAAIVAAASILLIIRWLYKLVRHREGLGLGDVKLIAMIAAFLGFWPAILALFFGVLSASAYALLLLARGKAGLASKLPLGTFISIGGLIAALFGSSLINTYTYLLR